MTIGTQHTGTCDEHERATQLLGDRIPAMTR